MKLNELEAMVKEQAVMIEALTKWQGEAQAVIKENAEELVKLHEHRASLSNEVATLAGIVELIQNLMGFDESDPEGPFFSELTALKAHVEELDVLVKGRNKSAAVKRNMTDADALSVLTGEYKDDAHKIAAEKIGLTYAQVYSCRMEYTFKHVLHELRKTEWKNPWKK